MLLAREKALLRSSSVSWSRCLVMKNVVRAMDIVERRATTARLDLVPRRSENNFLAGEDDILQLPLLTGITCLLSSAGIRMFKLEATASLTYRTSLRGWSTTGLANLPPFNLRRAIWAVCRLMSS